MQTTITDLPLSGPPRRKAVLDLPEGWYRVLSGPAKPGDRHVNCQLWVDTGAVEWIELAADDIRPVREHGGTAEYFLCLIRRGEPVEELCPGCYWRAKKPGYKFCPSCSFAYARKERKRATEGRG